jgi:FkbM family methyltransferase
LLCFLLPLLSLYFRTFLLPAKNGYIIRTKDLKFKCPLEAGFNSVFVFKEVVVSEVYERFFKTRRRWGLVIDCGAHIGFFSIKMAKKAKKVIAIEPFDVNVSFLTENIRMNHITNISVIQKAVGSRKEKRKLFLGESYDSPSFRPLSNSYVEVEVDTLDNICKSQDVQRIDILKVDVEGAELEVLRGAEESLKVTRNIAMELHYEGEGEEVKDYLEKRGFKVRVVGNMLYASRS